MARGTGARVAGWMMVAGALLSLFGAPLVALSLRPGNSWQASTNSAALVGGALLLALGALLWIPGLTMYVLIPAFSKSARDLQDYGSHRVVAACTLLATLGGNLIAVLYFVPAALVAMIGTSRGGGNASEMEAALLSPTGIAVAAVSLDLALLAVVYLRILRPGEIPWSALGLGVRRLPGGLLLGLGCGLLLFAANSLLEILLSRIGIQQTQGTLFQSVARATPQEFGLVLLAGAAVAPVIEEIFFRGYVFRAYLARKGTWQAFLFSAGLFAAVHGDLPAFLPIFAMGLLLSLFYYRTGSLVPSIVAHALNNAVAFTMLYLGIT